MLAGRGGLLGRSPVSGLNELPAGVRIDPPLEQEHDEGAELAREPLASARTAPRAPGQQVTAEDRLHRDAAN